MRTSCVKNGLVIATILLFVGVAVQPSIATPQLKKIDVEPDVEGLVTELRIVINEILQDYGYNPMVAYLSNYILGILDSSYSRAFCILYLITLVPIAFLLVFLSLISRNAYHYLMPIAGIIALNWDLECAHYFFSKSIQPLRTISTLTDLDKCPCMQQ